MDCRTLGAADSNDSRYLILSGERLRDTGVSEKESSFPSLQHNSCSPILHILQVKKSLFVPARHMKPLFTSMEVFVSSCAGRCYDYNLKAAARRVLLLLTKVTIMSALA